MTPLSSFRGVHTLLEVESKQGFFYVQLHGWANPLHKRALFFLASKCQKHCSSKGRRRGGGCVFPFPRRVSPPEGGAEIPQGPSTFSPKR